jgi:capsule polysaccharide export protein KpsC/LpsZ
LTLGRQIFSESMTEWLSKTVSYFAENAQVQLVVRIHPGEMITKGPSVAGVVQRVLPDLPENIILVPADADVNTYDLVAIADLGLVYTTTVGLEMAMSGVPAIVIGQTHYRGKGFTFDPDTWESYFSLLDDILDEPARFRLPKEQIDLAWEYAYRFFFEYPQPFPWHVVHMWDDIKTWTFDKVLGENGQEIFGSTFRYLVGEPVDWSQIG